MTDLAWWETVLRVVVAAALGGVLGLEREDRGKRAGLRTHMLLALGSGVFGVVSVGSFNEADLRDAPANLTIDVSRIASYVAAGVGFVGAGAILRGTGEVKGLTTATSLWVASAVGLAAGLGYWEAGITGALVGLAVLRMPPMPRRRPKVDDLTGDG
jgi:putative Mg2+ transporter-C (MgtC) family protein